MKMVEILRITATLSHAVSVLISAAQPRPSVRGAALQRGDTAGYAISSLSRTDLQRLFVAVITVLCDSRSLFLHD